MLVLLGVIGEFKIQNGSFIINREELTMYRIIVILAAIILIATPVLAEESNMTKAENFIKAGRLRQAKDALEAEIAENSGNAEAYFKLGDIRLCQKDFIGADEEFTAAITFRPAYRAEVGKKFYAVGLAALKSGEVDQAKDLFQRTLKLDSAQAKSIADTCLVAVKKYFAISQPEKAEKLASLILSDKTLAPQFRAEWTKYGEKIIREAKIREEGLKAVPYVGQARVDAVFPEPKWETVLERNLIGKGFIDDGAVFIAKFGSEIKVDDKVSLVSTNGETFKVAENGVWIKYPGKLEFDSGCEETASYYMSAEKGVEVALKVQRLVQTPKQEHLVANNIK